MNISPTARTILTAVLAGLTALGALLPTLTNVPVWVGVLVAVVSASLGSLGLVPPQTGGTQRGFVSPSIIEPPTAQVDEGRSDFTNPNSPFGV